MTNATTTHQLTGAGAAKVSLQDWTNSLGYLLPKKEFLRSDEVARALSCDLKTVLRHFETGALRAINIATKQDGRQELRYERSGVILFIANRANYSPEDLKYRLVEILKKQSPADLRSLQAVIVELLRRTE
jgi:hypothetical protein